MATKPCNGCGEIVGWIMTEAGKKMPVNIKKVTVMVCKNPDDHKALMRFKSVTGFVSHFATCVKADDFRNKKPIDKTS